MRRRSVDAGNQRIAAHAEQVTQQQHTIAIRLNGAAAINVEITNLVFDGCPAGSVCIAQLVGLEPLQAQAVMPSRVRFMLRSCCRSHAVTGGIDAPTENSLWSIATCAPLASNVTCVCGPVELLRPGRAPAPDCRHSPPAAGGDYGGTIADRHLFGNSWWPSR